MAKAKEKRREVIEKVWRQRRGVQRRNGTTWQRRAESKSEE